LEIDELRKSLAGDTIREVSIDEIHDQCRPAARGPELAQEVSMWKEPIQQLIDFAGKKSSSDLMANAVSPAAVGVGSPKRPALWSSPPVADAVRVGRLKAKRRGDLGRKDRSMDE
jgi:hypothetical protein